MSWFTTRADRLAGASRALAPLGFTPFTDEHAERLRKYEPFELLPSPFRYEAASFGEVDGHRFEIYEYESSYTDQDGQSGTRTEWCVVARHPRIRGGASFTPDYPRWGGAAAVLDILFWIPPFTILKAFQLAMDASNPDRTVGHGDFDHYFKVRASSDEAAQEAIPPALRDAVSKMQRQMTVELRDSLLICSPHGVRLDEEQAVTMVAITAALLASY